MKPTLKLLVTKEHRGFLAAALLAFVALPLGGQEQAKPPGPSPPAKAEYMGSAVCQGCHEEIFNGLQKNPHFKVDGSDRWGFKEQVCESCHGPGSLHAEAADPALIRNPLKVPLLEANRICLKCHLNQPSRVGSFRIAHARNQVACVLCHSIHKPKPKRTIEICGTCHLAQVTQFQRPYRHRLMEGAIDCIDCHNPHGRLLPGVLREVSANEPACFKCHGDKRGPFTFEHVPVRTEGCTACHEPHGSANPRMLIRANVRFLCLECHSNLGTSPSTTAIGGVPPAFHDLRSPRIQNCTICHVKIHGSHVNKVFLR